MGLLGRKEIIKHPGTEANQTVWEQGSDPLITSEGHTIDHLTEHRTYRHNGSYGKTVMGTMEDGTPVIHQIADTWRKTP